MGSSNRMQKVIYENVILQSYTVHGMGRDNIEHIAKSKYIWVISPQFPS